MNRKWMYATYFFNVVLIAIVVLLCLSPLYSQTAMMQQHKPEKALRLTLHYIDDTIQLSRIETVDMIIPLTVKEQFLKENESPDSYYFEILDNQDKIILRSRMRDPSMTLLEYEDPKEPGKIIGEQVKHEDITSSILVPAYPKADAIRFGRVFPGQENTSPDQRKYKILGSYNLHNVK